MVILLIFTITSTASAGTYTDLYNIINTDTTGTITLNEDYTYTQGVDNNTIYGASQGIKINKTITIEGNNHLISGNNLQRGFWVTENGTLTLKNLLISDCLNTTQSGGAIYSEGTLTMEKVTFAGNTGRSGGAIFNTGPSLTITDSIFRLNSVTGDGNYSLGGAIYNTGTLVIRGSTFEDNAGSGNVYGGAIYQTGGPSTTITNTLFTNNTVNYWGGAIYAASQALSLTNVTFTRNNASYGGAVYTTKRCTTINVVNSNFTENRASGLGGAIYIPSNETNKIIVNNTGFYRNTATLEGGAILLMRGELTVIDSEFIDNQASFNLLGGRVSGGAIFIDKYSSLTINNGTFINNTASNTGAAVSISNDSTGVNIQNSRFEDNSVRQPSPGIDSQGGALYIGMRVVNAQINNTVFTNNQGEYGGAIYIDEDGIASVTNSNISNNQATDGFGGAIFKGDGGSLTINNVAFNNNTAHNGNGGTIATGNDVNLQINGSSFTNTSTDDPAGGALYLGIENGRLTLTNSIFNNTSSSTYGGAIFIGSNAYPTTITNVRFINTQSANGGAIYIDKTSNRATLTNTTFTDSTASAYGGAIYTLAPLTLDVNTADEPFTNIEATLGGGAIYSASKTDLTINSIHDLIFRDYNVENYGGAIFSNANLIFNMGTNKVSFINNTAKYGGALYLDGNEITSSPVTSLSNMVFTDNTATDDGGAIYSLNDIILRLNNIQFTNNKASTGYGGAIYTTNQLTSDNTNYTNNQAGSTGGAIYTKGRLNIDNNIFNDNTATSGGAIYQFEGTSTNIGNSNFTNNKATNTTNGDGGALYLDTLNTGSQVTLTNLNFNANDAGRYGGSIYIEGDDTLTNIEITNSTSGDSGGAIFNNNGNLKIDNLTTTNTKSTKGGVIYSKSHLDIKNSLFTLSLADGTTGTGGVIFLETGEILKVTDTKMYNNTANTIGGAIYTNPNSNVEIIRSEFISNKADTGGAATISEGSSINIVNTLFQLNNALAATENNVGGGALVISGAGTTSISNSRFINNSAVRRAGAMYVGKDNSLTLEDSLFENNTANGQLALNGSAGAIVVENGAYVSIKNTNFNDNSARNKGGAIYINRGASVILDSAIFNSNIATDTTSYGGGIFVESNATLESTTIDTTFENNSAAYGGAIANAGFAISEGTISFLNNHATVEADNIYIITGGTPKKTANVIVIPTQGESNGIVQLIANITESGTNKPVEDGKVVFWINGVNLVLADVINGTAIGEWDTSKPTKMPGIYSLMAQFGESNYYESKNSTETTLTLIGKITLTTSSTYIVNSKHTSVVTVKIFVNGKTATGVTPIIRLNNGKVYSFDGVTSKKIGGLTAEKYTYTAWANGYSDTRVTGTINGIANVYIKKVARKGNYYTITIRNAGSARTGKATRVKLYYTYKGRTYTKTAYVKPLLKGKEVKVRIYLKRTSKNKRVYKYVYVNYNKIFKESTYADNKRRLSK